MKHLFFSSILAFSFMAEANVLKGAKNDVKTAKALAKCKSAVKIIDVEIPETIVCPRVLKFTFKDSLTATELKKIVAEELTFSLAAKTSDWSTMIPESFALQSGFVAETLSEGSGLYTDKVEKKIRTAMKAADAAVAEISQMLIFKGNSLGSKVFIDTDATWGTKVKAKAVLILNAPHRTVEVYLHGDLDG